MKHPTIFCDIDGTIFKYRKFENIFDEKASLIDGIQKYLKHFSLNGGHIVITTARPNNLREFTIDELIENNIPFDQLVMGIGRGERILINDSEFENVPRAIAIALNRNQSIEDYIKNK
jgi:predicted secreted acid phosphatase